jgi:carbamoyl-phosphate synthase large subunit
VLVAGQESIQTCVNKRKFYIFLIENNISPVPILNPTNICDSDFPVFVRPIIGSGGRGCFLAKSRKDIAELDSGKYLVHPNIVSREYSIDVLMDLTGKKTLQSVCRERVSVSAGESKISKVAKMPEIESAAEYICGKLELVGHNVLQAFCVDSKVIMIEANARFGGASNISIKAGLNSVDRIVRMFCGDETAYINQEIKQNLIMYRFSEDYICEQ